MQRIAGVICLALAHEAPLAAGWRVAGAQVLELGDDPRPAGTALSLATRGTALLAAAEQRQPALLLLTPAFAAALPQLTLERALGGPVLTSIIPAAPPLPYEPAERARRQLGLEDAP